MTRVFAIRQATSEDYDGLIPRLDDWWGGRSMASMLPRLFFSHFGPWSYIAEQDGRSIGFLCGFRSQTDPSIAYCHFIGISPEARGQGVGEALYMRLFVDAQSAGCTEVHAVTSPRNGGSIAFHRRLGFDMIPGLRESDGISWHPDYDGPGEDRVCFKRELQNLNL